MRKLINCSIVDFRIHKYTTVRIGKPNFLFSCKIFVTNYYMWTTRIVICCTVVFALAFDHHYVTRLPLCRNFKDLRLPIDSNIDS